MHYLKKLEEIGFEIKSNRSKESILLNGISVGIYNQERKIPIQITISPKYGTDILEAEINAAELLQNKGIPYRPNIQKESVEQFREKVKRESDLLKRLEKITNQPKI